MHCVLFNILYTILGPLFLYINNFLLSMQKEFILMAFDLVCETVIYSALSGIVREK